MKIKPSDIIIVLLFIGSIITGFIQTQLKNNAQIILLAFGFITLLSFLIKNNSLSTVLFYLLSILILFITYFGFIYWIMDFIYPPSARGWVTVGAERHRVMDMSWIGVILFSTIVAPLTMLVYHKITKNRNRKKEMILTLFFVIISGISCLLFRN
ncbi:MAG: hypothetical protein ABI199_06135 [Bacteroidia bacterium]